MMFMDGTLRATASSPVPREAAVPAGNVQHQLTRMDMVGLCLGERGDASSMINQEQVSMNRSYVVYRYDKHFLDAYGMQSWLLDFC